jgi:hypothetical protein
MSTLTAPKGPDTLTFCSDLAAADWIVHSNLPWQRLVCLDPADFDACLIR